LTGSRQSLWLVAFLLGSFFSQGAVAECYSVSQGQYPVIVAEGNNLNDFGLFATSGWDGNWYVGYNHAWVTRLPVSPRGNYVKAFLGAKLGRAKNVLRRELELVRKHLESLRELPRDRRDESARQLNYGSFSEIGKKVQELEKKLSTRYCGKIYVGINSIPQWDENQSFLLVSEEDIPLEGDPEEALEGVGEARWFWVEIPLSLVSFDKENYVAIWSPDENLSSAQVAPILASAWGTTTVNTWLDENSQGKPPSSSGRSVTVFEPALAIKLVPPNENIVSVEFLGIGSGEEILEKRVVNATVSGADITRAWLEVSQDEPGSGAKRWLRVGRIAFSAPYSITLDPDRLDEGDQYIRVGAEDFLGNVGYSEAIKIVVKK